MSLTWGHLFNKTSSSCNRICNIPTGKLRRRGRKEQDYSFYFYIFIYIFFGLVGCESTIEELVLFKMDVN